MAKIDATYRKRYNKMYGLDKEKKSAEKKKGSKAWLISFNISKLLFLLGAVLSILGIICLGKYRMDKIAYDKMKETVTLSVYEQKEQYSGNSRLYRTDYEYHYNGADYKARRIQKVAEKEDATRQAKLNGAEPSQVFIKGIDSFPFYRLPMGIVLLVGGLGLIIKRLSIVLLKRRAE